MASGLLSDLLNDLRRGQEAIRKATARCEWEKDPRTPGRTAWRITGHTREAVQHAITQRQNEVEAAGGYAVFVGPALTDDGMWGALGETVLRQQPVREAAE